MSVVLGEVGRGTFTGVYLLMGLPGTTGQDGKVISKYLFIYVFIYSLISLLVFEFLQK